MDSLVKSWKLENDEILALYGSCQPNATLAFKAFYKDLLVIKVTELLKKEFVETKADKMYKDLQVINLKLQKKDVKNHVIYPISASEYARRLLDKTYLLMGRYEVALHNMPNKLKTELQKKVFSDPVIASYCN